MISFGFTRLPLTWRELLVRTFKEFVADNGLGLAAQLAYYFFFALFPAILVGIALASFFPLEHFLDRPSRRSRGWCPRRSSRIVQEQMRKISEGDDGGILTFGLLVALWSSSAAMVGLIDALNRAYDIEEGRPWWKVRLLAVGLTIVWPPSSWWPSPSCWSGPTVAEYVARSTGLGPTSSGRGRSCNGRSSSRWCRSGTGFVHYFAPDAEQDWVWITPGAVLTTVLWLARLAGLQALRRQLRGATRRHTARSAA